MADFAPDLLDTILDDIGTTPSRMQTKGETTKLPVGSLKPFPDHRFKLLEGEPFWAMVESVKNLGILCPVIVWKKSNDYIILSGHNRCEAAKEAGLYEVPVIIKEDISDEDAVLIVTETNLRQRSFADLRHSERALCLQQHYEAMKKQGRRKDLVNEINSLLDPSNPHEMGEESTFRQCGERLKHTDESIGEEYGLSSRNVSRYIRVANLNNRNLLNLLDDGTVAFLAAVEISYIADEELQNVIYKYISEYNYRLDIKKAETLRELYRNNKLNSESMLEVFTGNSKLQRKMPSGFKLKQDIINKYFPEGGAKKEISGTIDKALEFYHFNKEGVVRKAVEFYSKHESTIEALDKLFPKGITEEELGNIISNLK